MMGSCRVSVVIPTRNRREKLQRALASLDQQTYRDFEVWLVDDGSTDGTGDFLESSQLQMTYPNIPAIHKITNAPSRGAAAARNQAMARANGELIAFLDDDDIWFPDYLQHQVNQLDNHPEVAACCAPHVEFDESGRFYQPDLLPLVNHEHALIHLLTDSFVHTMSIFVCRHEAFRAIGPFEEKLGIVHDWDWYARLLLSGLRILAPAGPALAGREIPGGLVTRHRTWHEEERSMLDRIFAQNKQFSGEEQHVRAHRALVFARIGLQRNDYAFAASRLLEAFRRAPLRSTQTIALRLARNIRAADTSKYSDHQTSDIVP
jgi:glycosyltransferase involved in cell wall biosynthesis